MVSESCWRHRLVITNQVSNKNGGIGGSTIFFFINALICLKINIRGFLGSLAGYESVVKIKKFKTMVRVVTLLLVYTYFLTNQYLFLSEFK